MKFNSLLIQQASELNLSSLNDLNAKLYPDVGPSLTFDNQCDIAKDFFAKIEADQIEAERIEADQIESDRIEAERIKEQIDQNSAATTIQSMVRGGLAKQLVAQMKTDIQNASSTIVSVDSAYEYKKFSDCTSLEELKKASFGPNGSDRRITNGNTSAFNTTVQKLFGKLSRPQIYILSTPISYAKKCELLEKQFSNPYTQNVTIDLRQFSKQPVNYEGVEHPQSSLDTISGNFLDGTEDLSGLTERQIQKLKALDKELAVDFFSRTNQRSGLDNFSFAPNATETSRNDSLKVFLNAYMKQDTKKGVPFHEPYVLGSENKSQIIKYQKLQQKMIEKAKKQPKSRIAPQYTREPAVPSKRPTSKASSSLASRPAWKVSAGGGDPNSGSKSLGAALRYNITKRGYGRYN